ncbi:hypothetical protein [Thomasclavelia ramosa]|uniref:hypothetical protein n=1 Tax=Thomasclavelia ramosa TaxID=1547 RepID=UPI0034B2E4B3
MNIKKILLETTISFILAGGLGYINYFILTASGVVNINRKDKDEKKFILILFSIINILLYQIIKTYIYNYIFAIFISLILSIIFSFTLYKWTLSILYLFINKIRDKNGYGEINNKSVRTSLFNRNDVLFVYVYDLYDDKLLSHGCMGWQNEDNSEFDFEIIPFEGLEELSYKEAIKKVEKNDDMSIYINVDKKIKIVIISEPKD